MKEEEIKVLSQQWSKASNSVSEVLVGQNDMVESLFMGLLTGGHVLLEGVPGLAKTLAVSCVSKVVDLDFQRVQFTPDLLPSDLVGTMIYSPKDEVFTVKKGPIFSNIILADEINRSPAKVQSALLEAMAEKQVTLGDTTYKMEDPFLVLATQNPIEQEGTYSLPEAQLDRFMQKIIVTYPKKEEEKIILNKMSGLEKPSVSPCLNRDDILKSSQAVDQIRVDEKIKDFIIDIIMATRNPKDYGLAHIASLIEVGASPRGTLSLIQSAKCKAFLNGQSYVDVDAIKSVAYNCLRHRLILNYEAQAESISSDDIISQILSSLKIS